MDITSEEISRAQKRLQTMTDANLQEEVVLSQSMIAFWQRRLDRAARRLEHHQQQMQQYQQGLETTDPLTVEVTQTIVEQAQETIEDAQQDLVYDQMNLQLCLQEQANRLAAAGAEHTADSTI